MSLLSLEEFRIVLGYNPYHFWGLSNARLAPTSACNEIVQEYGWQGTDAAGRADIRKSLETAEGMIADRLHYWPAPKYLEETVTWPAYHDRTIRRAYNVEPDGRRTSVRMKYGKIQDLGYETRTTLGTYPVNIAETDNCLQQHFTMDFATTETDASLLHVEFADADRVVAAERDWEVRPVDISITGGRCRVQGKLWLIVKPSLYEEGSIQENGNSGLDPDNRNTFVIRLKVVKVTYTSGITEDTAQAVLRWESRPCHGWYCCETSSLQNEPAATYYSVARSGVRSAEYGEVTPDLALYNATDQTWGVPVDWCCGSVEPDTVTIRYLSGQPLVNGRMARGMADAVARLTMSEMSRRLCACDVSNRELYRWQFDLANDGDGEKFRTTDADLNSPFGTSRGAVWAWKQIKSLALRRGKAV